MKLIQRTGLVVVMLVTIVAIAAAGCTKKGEETHDSHAEEKGHSDNDGHDHSKH